MDWPSPADTDAAERLLDRFARIGPAEARLATQPGTRAMLAAIGGNSPYLSDLAVREAATVARFVRRGPDAVVARALREVARCPALASRADVAAILRRAKRQVALATALADIGGAWTLAQVTGALSGLAAAALTTAVDHLLRAAQAQGSLRLPHRRTPSRDCGFTVLGMGKLGARELNYSSDVDLVLIFDPARHPGHADGPGPVFSRLARDLCVLMEARDADGYVFRTDLRLRPDPSATPPAVSLPAALAYYESAGENWERAAMIKARPVAGDLALGQRFLDEIRPFVWRRHLDFAALIEIRAMKRRMDDHHATALPDGPDPVERVARHDVKLGEGGIRGVEFAVQARQLVWGGRDPRLRGAGTLEALESLVTAGHISQNAAAQLSDAYGFLRRTEHRLQMVADRQTHALPPAACMGAFATFMGYPDAAAYAADLLPHLLRVRQQDGELFANPVADDQPALTADTLTALGFTEPERVIAAVRAWRSGTAKVFRSERAKALLEQVLPHLLRALARQREPDAAFARADRLLTRPASSVQLLTLLHRRPALLDRVADVLGAAPSLADHLAQVPAALEGLLAPDNDPDPAVLLAAQLGDARGLDDAAAIVRRTVRGEEFRLSVGQMEGRIDVDTAGTARTALADGALRALLPLIWAEHAKRYGAVDGGGLAIVLLGKAGGREMMAGSDLDLMLVYDHPEDVTESRGPKQLPASQYYTRLAHAVVAVLTAPGSDGPLYAVDMRLRPSGNKGPVAVSLAAFVRYHAQDAWTWERMALTRARCVTGPDALVARVDAAILAAMAAHGVTAVRADATAMRSRMLRELPPHGPWDVKLRPGGQIEVEFVVQVLLLLCPAARPAVTVRQAVARLLAAGALTPGEAALLTDADHFWRTIQSLLRITVGAKTPALLPPHALDVLLKAAGGCDEAAFRARLDSIAAQVRAVFEHRVGVLG